MTKQEQTRKVRRVNTKKMSLVELNLYKDYINEIADGKCQCGCNREISTYHHSCRGSNKDDKSLGGINYICHDTLHFSTDSHEREALTILFKGIGRENWRLYTESML